MVSSQSVYQLHSRLLLTLVELFPCIYVLLGKDGLKFLALEVTFYSLDEINFCGVKYSNFAYYYIESQL